MKTTIKNRLIVAIMAMAFVMMSFAKKAYDTLYGGTASVTVQAVNPNGNQVLLIQMNLDNVKVGDKRVIEVNTNCSHNSKADAQADLQYSIKSEMGIYEKQVSAISYDISTCD